MRKRLTLLVVLAMMLGPMQVPAAGSSATEQQAVQDTAAVSAEGKKGKEKDRSLFWIVLGVSFLFVLGSALALNNLGDKRPPPGRRKDGGGVDGGDRKEG